MKILSFFIFFWVIFPAICMRIRIRIQQLKLMRIRIRIRNPVDQEPDQIHLKCCIRIRIMDSFIDLKNARNVVPAVYLTYVYLAPFKPFKMSHPKPLRHTINYSEFSNLFPPNILPLHHTSRPIITYGTSLPPRPHP
jgi:hypothetical protein